MGAEILMLDGPEGIDVELQTVVINDNTNAREFINLVKKIRSGLMKGYNVHITNKFTL